MAKPIAAPATVLSVRPSARRHVPALDGIRGVAILLVLLQHIRVAGVSAGYDRVAEAGWVGVDLFFVLSGFLITGILLDTKEQPSYFKNFYMRRLLRIFPLCYAFLFFIFVLLARFHPFESAGYTDAVRHQWWFWAYLTNVRIAIHGSWSAAPAVAHFWSLAIEEQFYLLWPTVVWLTSRRQLTIACLALIVGSLLLRVAARIANVDSIAIYVITPMRLDTLAVGALLAIAVRDPASAAAIERWRWHSLLTAGLALVVVIVVRGGLNQMDVIVQTIGYSLLALFFGALVLVSVEARPGTVLHAIVGAPTLRACGRYSYAMYVLHPYVTGLVQPRMSRFLPASGGVTAQLMLLLVGAAATFMAALLSWMLLESPFLKLKRFFEYAIPPQPLADLTAVGAAEGGAVA